MVCNGVALAASALAYDPLAPARAFMNRSWNAAICALSA